MNPARRAPIPRVDVLGVPVSATTPDRALDEVTRWIDDGAQQFATFTGVHGVMESRRDPDVLRAHRDAALVATDGMPLVWAARRAGVATAERVYGPDFVLAIAARAAARDWSMYLYGAAPGVAARLGEVLAERFPGLRIVGTHAPPFRALNSEEDAAEVESIVATRPDIVLVGLSTPLQERWMAEHVGRLGAGALLGVGAAFDQHTGRVRRAPGWMQRAGLEWSFRLLVEPRRLWRRYLRNNPAFLWAIMRQRPRIVDEPEPTRDRTP